MRKFSGKCFTFAPRHEGSIKTNIELGGLAGFSISRNTIPVRGCEGNRGMNTAEVNHWEKLGREGTEAGSRLNQCHEYTYLMSRLDTTHNRRDNEEYNR